MKIVLNLIIFTFSLFVYSQEIYVLDEVTMEPISGALLYEELNGGVKKGTMSDINGAVSLSAFENAKVITISHISYLNRTLEFSNIRGNILLKPDSNNLDEIVISASKFSQNLKEISQRVIFISTEDVVLSNPQTSADLLSSSGNVYIQKSQLGGGSPMIRGFSTNRLTLSVDGVRLNNAIFRGGNIQNVISVDPFNIQNTEIVLGSSSVIYGSDAIGGAMNFQTKKPVLSKSESIFF
jgi:hemoglobin/transferrin/lactoferrin receptor protein